MLSDPSAPAADLLTAIEARYDQPDIAPGEVLPARRYVGHGQPGQIAADDPSLMVAMVNLPTEGQSNTSGQTGTAAHTLVTHRVNLQARLLRCIPTFDEDATPPPASAITASSQVLLRDAARLVDAVHAWADVLPPEWSIVLGAVEPQGPSGRLGGNRLTVSLGPL
jgi:hypothetical protein